MKIVLLEEFPNKVNLENKLEELDSPVNLIVAAPCLQDFERIRDKLKAEEVILGYWPLLPKNMGYWLSPFSDRKGLEQVVDEIKQAEPPLDVLWDAEPPIYDKSHVLGIIKSLIKGKWRENAEYIKESLHNLSDSGINLVTAEWPISPDKQYITGLSGALIHKLSQYKHPAALLEFLMENLCLKFDPDEFRTEKMEMAYSRQYDEFKRICEQGKAKYSNRFSIGIGCLGFGIKGNENQLSEKQLYKYLQIAASTGIPKAYIYRLGGATEQHLKVLRAFLQGNI